MAIRSLKTFLIAGAVAFLLSLTQGNAIYAQDVSGDIDPSLSVAFMELNSDAGMPVITGQVTNMGTKPCEFVYLLITLFDEEEQNLGVTYDSTQYLKPGDVWPFRCQLQVPTNRISWYRVVRLTCSASPPQYEQPIPIPR
jgi:hypothetical protein